MKPQKFYSLFLWAGALTCLTFLSLGCLQNRVQKVKAYEGDLQIPYEIMGSLEVSLKSPSLRVSDLGYWSTEILTLSLAHTPARGDRLKAKLDKKLIQKARGHYNADAVIKVKYWPDPASSSYPDGRIHAEGQMIRFLKFPEDHEVIKTEAEDQLRVQQALEEIS